MRKILLLFIFALISIAFASQLENTLEGLQMFQGGDGGLNDEQLNSATQLSAKGSLTVTKHGIFLAALYNQFDKITLNGIGEFLKERARPDGGYAFTPEDSSDLHSTRDVLLIYHFLGMKPQNQQDLLAFARSLYDEKTGLYAVREGEEGSIEATSSALQIFSILGALKAPFVTSHFEKINQILKEAVVESDQESFFSFPSKTVSAITANFHAISIGLVTEFNFTNPESFANYFVTLQKSSGGFSSGGSGGNYKNTFESIASLSILSMLAKKDLISGINSNTLESYLEAAGPRLSDISYAAQTKVASGTIRKVFKAELILENESGETIEGGLVEGTKFRPSLRVVGYEELASPRFVVELDTQFAGEKDHFNMLYSKDKSRYISTELFDTGKNLGQITFFVSARFTLATVGTVVLDFGESRTVGYRLNIVPKAFLEVAGKDIAVGESVSSGTEFTFDLSLATASNEKPKIGDVTATLNVIDSTGATIDQIEQKGSSDQIISFTYTLNKVSIPSGSLTFSFEVSDGKVGVHSTGKVAYKLSTVMVASEIKFSGFSRSKAPVYKVGDSVEVTMVPASLPDLSTVHVLESKDFFGNAISREFYMDVLSSTGSRIHSIKATPSSSGAYSFILSLAPRLDSFGANNINFRYISKSGDNIELRLYDSEFSELYEDSSNLNFTVPSDLRLVEVEEAPTGDDFFYGNTISFKFKLKDENSGQLIKAGAPGATVFLSLVHKDESKATSFTSVIKPAQQVGEYFEIDMRITPNAIKGPAEINLYAQGVNNQKLTILDSQGKVVSYKVKIGGEIEVAPNTYSSVLAEADKTTVVATFKLSCQGNPLFDAQLFASLVKSDGSVVAENLPVVSYKDTYQVSYTVAHDLFPEGSYKFNLYRNVADESAAASSEDVTQPLVTISLSHSGTGSNSLPFSPQMVIVTLLLVGFGFIWFKRSEILAVTSTN